MWVTLSSEIYAEDLIELQRMGYVRGKYYKVESRNDYESYSTYTVTDLLNFERKLAPIHVDFFKEPITHVKCIDNEDKEDKLTKFKTYEILDMGYVKHVGNDLWITIRQDNGKIGKYTLSRFIFFKCEDIDKNQNDIGKRDDKMSVIECVLGFGLGVLICMGIVKLLIGK